MSGGSMNYLYSKLEHNATFSTDTPERKAFKAHLAKVAKALHDIEWVDSCDMGPGDENAAIRACLQPDAVLFTLVEQAKDVMAAIRAEVEKHEQACAAIKAAEETK
jgi:hypothetical protein